MFISEICKEYNLKYLGNDVKIDGLNILGRISSKKSILSYVTNDGYVNEIAKDRSIKTLVIHNSVLKNYEKVILERDGGFIISDYPERDFYIIHEFLIRSGFYNSPVEKKSISKTASIHPTAIVEENVIIEDGVVIGPYSVIKSGTIIKKNSEIGTNTVIGAEGFQVVRISGIPHHITHCGGTLIGENVYIGDNCTISNNLFDGFTEIGDNTKIDNFCYIAHYVKIGKNVIITSRATIVGSATIEDNSYIGAASTIMNHVVIHKGATIGIGAVVVCDVEENAMVVGNPAFRIQ